MKKRVLLACLLLGTDPARADAPLKLPSSSLFFTAEETRAAENLAEKSAPPGTADIRLGAVFYYDPADWTIWLQGEKWTPATSRDGLRVVHVSPDRVDLVWRDDNDTERAISLHPHETYHIATGSIVP